MSFLSEAITSTYTIDGGLGNAYAPDAYGNILSRLEQLNATLHQHQTDSNKLRIRGQDTNDRAGLIRTVPHASLVFKRADEDGTYTEMWIYNVRNNQIDASIKRNILSGTDIIPSKNASEDGTQHCSAWVVGNLCTLIIKGLPN